ncbi:hypothetical protein CJF31_00007224 [Rutstroemia sp. NJR-2017a BVV2]|nr:hypothetical protein CJF31_00007224 [Rutstroemia sp. NJR-2017a BVV2]
MAEKEPPRVLPGPNFYKLEELGSYVDAASPVLDLKNDQNIDSALSGMSARSSLASVDSELYQHIEENGRTYHRYKMGHFQHRFLRMTIDGKLFISPVDTSRPINVLDIATGTGIWAVEFGVARSVPPNCSFHIEDAEDPWTFSEELKFDLIHGRVLLSCFRSPKTVFTSAFNALAPGGYLELRDPIFPFQYATPPPKDCALVKWNNLILEASAKAGRPWNNGAHYKRWLEEIGFVDIVERREYAPMNPWAKGQRNKVLSIWVQRNVLMGLEALSMALFTRILGMEKREVEQLLLAVERDIKDKTIHCYSEGYDFPLEPVH